VLSDPAADMGGLSSAQNLSPPLYVDATTHVGGSLVKIRFPTQSDDNLAQARVIGHGFPI
jgi:hypothetical protein